MQINWNDLALLSLLSATIHWTIARSTIMHWFWSRARGRLADLLACPACSGFWIGCCLTAAGIQAVTPVGYPDSWPVAVASIVANGLLGIFMTPVTEGVLLWGLSVSALEIVKVPTDD
jgi:hypothetical protein